jgi:hypothetical protein
MLATAVIVLLLALALIVAILLGTDNQVNVLVNCIRRVIQAGETAA